MKNFNNYDEILKYLVDDFSSDNFFSSEYRKILEEKFSKKLTVLDFIDRKSVSFQLSKKAKVHNWLKYKEGFSEQLVDFCLEKMELQNNAVILDPFAGSGTTNFVCQTKGINSVGFDILPTSELAIKVKSNIKNFNITELKAILYELESLRIPYNFKNYLEYIPITDGAYPRKTNIELAFINKWISENKYSELSNSLLQLCIVNSLEDISYTKKDGQYLRWDYRSTKVKNQNALRIKKGKEQLKTKLDKGKLPSAFERIKIEFLKKIDDIYNHQKSDNKYGNILFLRKNVLFELPKFMENSLDGVITSPPYCNRYDYTRSYALELVYLGLNNSEIKNLRQNLLTCTVENKSKENDLHNIYKDIGALDRYEFVKSILLSNKAYSEIIEALNSRKNNNDLNNNNIISMVKNYIFELAILYSEIFRVCKNGAKVYFVNDNVRYGGEVIPIDFLSSEIAENLGFKVSKIFCIKQQKGNSSQQMKKFGRVPLRKSITEWIVQKS